MSSGLTRALIAVHAADLAALRGAARFFEYMAKQNGWLVISETAGAGFVNRIVRQHLPQLLREFDPDAVRRRLTTLSGPLDLGSASWDSVEAHVVEAGLRNQMELLTDVLAIASRTRNGPADHAR